MRRFLAATPFTSLTFSLLILLVALVASDLLAHSLAETIDLLLAGGALVAVGAVTGYRRFHRLEAIDPTRGPVLRASLQLGLYLSPVVLLTIAFPIATHRIAHVSVGGVPLTALLLASSLTVPWLSQAVCLPLYRGIGGLIASGDREEIEKRLCRLWPVTYLQCLAVIVVFAVPVEVATRWPLGAFGAYVALCAIYVAFAQSLIIGIVGKRRVLWAVGWGLFAAALLAAPSLWFLPPAVGLATQLVPLRKRLAEMLYPVRMHWQEVGTDMLRGLLLGAVLWSDKLFFFLRSGQQMPVTDIFLALLPAILAYNYYFVRLAPGFDASVLQLRTAMERERYASLAARSRQLARVVEDTVARTALVGAVLGVLVTFLVGVTSPHALRLVATVTAASWLFMMTTVLCYKLDYIGQRTKAQVISAAHLVGCAVAFAVFPVGAPIYGALIVVEASLFVIALRSCMTAWESSEYLLFWRHATAW